VQLKIKRGGASAEEKAITDPASSERRILPREIKYSPVGTEAMKFRISRRLVGNSDESIRRRNEVLGGGNQSASWAAIQSNTKAEVRSRCRYQGAIRV